MKTLVVLWQKVPKPMQKWLKGLEVAVVTGTVSAVVTMPMADFKTKGGIAKFIAEILVVAGGCVRLYLTQSPVQEVVREVAAQRTNPDGSTETLVATSTSPAPLLDSKKV